MAIETSDVRLKVMLVSMAVASYGPDKELYEAAMNMIAEKLGWKVMVLQDIVMMTRSSYSRPALEAEFKRLKAEYGSELPQAVH